MEDKTRKRWRREKLDIKARNFKTVLSIEKLTKDRMRKWWEHRKTQARNLKWVLLVSITQVGKKGAWGTKLQK